MYARSSLVAILACLSGTFACKNGDCTNPSADAEPTRFLRWAQIELDRPADIQELTVGDGRLAQNDRRMELSATVSDSKGNVLADGPFGVEWPRWEAEGDGIVRRSSRGNDRLFGAIAGMRVGGERQFSLGFRRQYPEECQVNNGHCNFLLGSKRVEVPNDNSLVFKAKLLSVCAPLYCERTTYSIPKSESHELIEKSCR